jgi:hypothetical protein
VIVCPLQVEISPSKCLFSIWVHAFMKEVVFLPKAVIKNLILGNSNVPKNRIDLMMQRIVTYVLVIQTH